MNMTEEEWERSDRLEVMIAHLGNKPPEEQSEEWSEALDAYIEQYQQLIAKPQTGRYLVGPLSNIRGIGPKKVDEILLARKTGKPLRPVLAKMLENAKTELDSLYPIKDRINILHPDLTAIGIQSRVMSIKEVQCGIEGPVVIAGVAVRIAPRDENDLQKVAKRGYKFSGPTTCLNMFVRDDSDEIFCKIDRYDFERLAKPIIEHGRQGKALYALKGTVPPDFRMISVERFIYLGDMAVKYVAPTTEE
jgi:hypothetical protein